MPLAVPEIIAGVRIATVSTVAIATLAIFAGAGGLGDVIYNEGVQNDVFKTNTSSRASSWSSSRSPSTALLLLAQRVMSPWRKVRTI